MGRVLPITAKVAYLEVAVRKFVNVQVAETLTDLIEAAVIELRVEGLEIRALFEQLLKVVLRNAISHAAQACGATRESCGPVKMIVAVAAVVAVSALVALVAVATIATLVVQEATYAPLPQIRSIGRGA